MVNFEITPAADEGDLHRDIVGFSKRNFVNCFLGSPEPSTKSEDLCSISVENFEVFAAGQTIKYVCHYLRIVKATYNKPNVQISVKVTNPIPPTRRPTVGPLSADELATEVRPL